MSNFRLIESALIDFDRVRALRADADAGEHGIWVFFVAGEGEDIFIPCAQPLDALRLISVTNQGEAGGNERRRGNIRPNCVRE